MKVFVYALSAISLAMAVPKGIGPPSLEQSSAVAPRWLSSQTPAQSIKPRELQGQINNKGGDQAADLSFNVKDGPLPDNITEITDKYLFQLSTDKFETQRNLRQPPALDWSSDGCTKAPDRSLGYNFAPACHRHDFGIQNYRKQRRLNKRTRRRIDDHFYEDLKQECTTHETELMCKGLAWGYYKTVKRYGRDKDGLDVSPRVITRPSTNLQPLGTKTS